MHSLVQGRWDQQLRLISGLILFAFVLTHFLNHALGLVNVEVMETVQDWRKAVTRSTAGSTLLLLAILTHILLALLRLIRRSTFIMPWWEALQILTGLTIPFLLIPHVVYSHGAAHFFGVDDTYTYQLWKMWPNGAVFSSFMMLFVWVHGCIGLHYWLRLSTLYRQLLPVLYALVVAIPLLAYAGFSVAGRVVTQPLDPDSFERLKLRLNWPDPASSAILSEWVGLARSGFAVLLCLVLLYVLFRYLRTRSGRKFEVDYTQGVIARTVAGPTLLEISRRNNIPHKSACGGRARCSTCRVRIEHGLELLHPPNSAERKTLKAIKAAHNVRLACQIYPENPLTVFRLIATHDRPADLQQEAVVASEASGVERELVIMFIDVRGFTRWSEGKLPYDIVFILNEFFTAASGIIRTKGGWIDKYMGDGMIAVFGREDPSDVAARQALQAAAEIDRALDAISDQLAAEVGEKIKVGIGLHTGMVVLGHIGDLDAGALTVIGEAVNTASRLEGLTTVLAMQLVASRQVMERAGNYPTADIATSTEIRGLKKSIAILGYKQARVLASAAAGATDPDDA